MTKLFLIVFSGIIFSTPIAAMPVFVTGDASAERHQVENLKQWASQYGQMKNQLDQMKQTYGAITGNGKYGLSHFDPSLVQYLPAEWKDVYNQVANQERGQIGSLESEIKRKEKFNPNLKDGEKRYYDTLTRNKAMTMEAFEKTSKRLETINKLMQKSNFTQNTKQAADLQNRIATENAIIQNEQTKINLMLKLHEIELKLAEEQKDREFRDKFFR